VALVTGLASALTIGSGGSAGREGPIVQIAASLGSTVAQLTRQPDETTRMMVAAGAAGGIAATFNAPIAGVFFALEVILRRFNLRNFGVVVLSAVVADAIAHARFGDHPAFVIPPYRLESPLEIPLYALLGVVAALVALLYVRALYWTEDRFEGMHLPWLLKPALGGVGVGIIAVWFVDVLGSGYGIGPARGTIAAMLGGEQELRTLVALARLKIAATALTLGSGGSGGVLSPSFFIGAAVGGAFGKVVGEAFPGIAAPSGAYATVGMAALFAGAAGPPSPPS